MRALRRFFSRLNSWRRAPSDEERLAAEIEEHLAYQTEENVRCGLSPAEARRQAVLKFGAVEAMRESYRDERGLPRLETFVQDIRHALRRFRLAPAFAIATVSTLALGIGATTSIFTLVDAVLLKSLPVARPGELYRVGRETVCCYLNGYSEDKGFSLVSYDLYTYLRDHAKGFTELAAVPSIEHLLGVRRAGSPEAARSYPGEFVSGNYFTMFGVAAYAGRTLLPRDDQLGAPAVAVMSYRLWQKSFASDPSVIGSVFNVDDKPFVVVGIAPPGFFGDTLRSAPPDFFLPLNTEPLVESDADLYKYQTHWLDLIGRIRPGVKPEWVEAEMRVELKQWLRSHWSEMSASERAKFPEQTLFLSPGGAGITSMREHYEHWLQILMTVTGFVMLIVCANVASLMLVRGMERRRQTSLSMALGARASRVVSQALTESVLLALFGGAAGLAVAFACTRLILRFAFPSMPGLAGIPIDASPSMTVLLFAFVISLLTGSAFGIAPAWIATGVDPIEALRGGRATARTGSLARKTLVVVQAALSLALLSAAGLLTAALGSLENQNFGFEQERRMVASMDPRLAGYRTNQLPFLYRRIRDAVAEIPGVSSVALCLYSPVNAKDRGALVWVDGHVAPARPEERLSWWNRVSAGYFETIGNPIVRGRGIAETDTPVSRHVAVINEAFARKYFGNEDPIGKHFGMEESESREFEIVGIAKDARFLGTGNLARPIGPMFYIPEAQADYTHSNQGSLYLHDVVILTKPGGSLPAERIRRAIASVEPNMPLVSIGGLKDEVASQFGQPRLIARLTSLFGLLSLVLASIGVYGVTAYNAGGRVSEIGVRIALGASRGNVIRLVLHGAFALILAGLLIGLPLTLAVGRFLGSQLYGLSPYNPAVVLAAVVALALPALTASFVPAYRASTISPVEALRVE